MHFSLIAAPHRQREIRWIGHGPGKKLPLKVGLAMEGVRGCYESRQSVTSAPLRGQLDGNWHSGSDAGFRMGGEGMQEKR